MEEKKGKSVGGREPDYTSEKGINHRKVHQWGRKEAAESRKEGRKPKTRKKKKKRRGIVKGKTMGVREKKET